MPKVDYVLCPLKKEYTPQMAAIEKICFSLPWSEETLNEDVVNPLAKYFVADKSGEVIGYIGSRIILDEVHITNVAVIPSRRHEGIGQCLVKAMIDYAAANNCAFITLEVRQGNLPARKLYEKLGFKVVGLRPRYYFNPEDNAVLMTLFLEKKDENTGN